MSSLATFRQRTSLVLLHLHAQVHVHFTVCIVIYSYSLPSPHSCQVQGQETSAGYELVIQSSPAHSVWKWKGRVCQKGLFPYFCLEVCHPSNMQSRCITRRGRASGDRHLENNVARASLQFSESATLHTLQMNFSADAIVKSSRPPFSRFLSSMWCSVNFFHDVSLL